MVHDTRNRFGSLTSLKEIFVDTSIETNGKKPKTKKDRTMRISEFTYRRMAGLSRRTFNVSTYDELLNVLLDAYDKSNNSTYPHYTRY